MKKAVDVLFESYFSLYDVIGMNERLYLIAGGVI